MQRSRISLAVLALMGSGLVNAQSVSDPQQLQRVEITGSNIKRIDAETSMPVQIIKREEIQRTGANSVRELIDTLTAATGSLSDISGSNSFASGASSATLRNLGKQSTLILLNSRRVAPYALADYSEVFTNLDALPLDAVDRIEVLRSGASAIYGSDAVAGVINIITRGDYQGIQVRASHEQSLVNEEFRISTASVTAGFGNLATDRFNILANVELFQRTSVMWKDVLKDVNPGMTKFFSGFGTPSTYSYPGNLIGVGPVPGCDPAFIISKLCRYDRYERFQAQPSADRVNMLVSGKLQINPDTQGFAELLYSKTKTEYLSPFPAYGIAQGTTVWGDPATGKAKTFYFRGLPATHPLNPTGEDDVEFRYRFADAVSNSVVKSTNFRALTGLKGTVGIYDWEAAVGYMGGTTDDKSRGTYSDSGFKKVIGEYDPNQVDPTFFNRGYKIGQVNSPEVLNTLFPAFGSKGKTSQVFVDGKISGEVTKFNDLPVTAALGFDLRHETFKVDPSAELRSGDIVGYGLSSVDAKRNYGSVFGEFNLPVSKTLEFQAAARVDKFPGISAQVSPKIGVRFEPTKSLLLRGTLEAGFRAPNLTESAPSTKFAFSTGVNDPKRCPQAQVLADDLLAASDALPANDPNKPLLQARADAVVNSECAGGVASILKNNASLKPEDSRSFTVGFVLEPVTGINVSLDYWNIKRRNEIRYKSTDDLLNAEDDQIAGTINRAGFGGDSTFTAAERAKYGVTVGPLESTVGQFENITKTQTSGIDLGGNARFNTGIGQLDLGFNGTYLISYKEFSLVKGAFGDNLAGRYTFPRLQANLSATLKKDNFVNSLKLNYTSSTILQYDFYDTLYTVEGCAARKWTESECKVKAYTTLDYYLAYTGVKNLTFGVNIRNLLNKRPPIDLRDMQANGGGIIPQNLADVKRRTLRLTMDYKFL
jgi:iron complex outermembrane receptor protein